MTERMRACRRGGPWTILPATLLVLAAPGMAATTAFTGARILPVSGAAIEDGVLVVDDGRIRAVGPRSRVRIPRDAERIDLSGRVVIDAVFAVPAR